MASSCQDQVHVYEDENRYVAKRASLVQPVARAAAIPGTISPGEYDWAVDPIWEAIVEEVEVSDFGILNEATLPIGYLLEKTEIRADGSEAEYENIFVPSMDPIHFADTSVRYGGLYVYRVRVLAMCRFEVISADPYNFINEEVVSVVCLIASGGTLFSVHCIENIPPPCPSDLTFEYDYEQDNLIIMWAPPVNPQRDHVRYRIFRRKYIEQPFTVIGEIDFDNSISRVVPPDPVPPEMSLRRRGGQTYWRDTDFARGTTTNLFKSSDYIYAVSCMDARALSSPFSMQFRVTFDSFKNKLRLAFISRCGAPMPYPNIFLNEQAFPDTMKDSGHSRIRLYFDPEFYKVLDDTVEVTSSIPVTFGAFTKGSSSKSGASPSKNPIVLPSPDLRLLADEYWLHIINVDLQQDWLIKINLLDNTGPPLVIRASEVIVRTLELDDTNVGLGDSKTHIRPYVPSGDPDLPGSPWD